MTDMPLAMTVARSVRVPLLGALLALCTRAADAQSDPSTRGFSITARGGFTSIDLPDADDSDREGGAAAGLQVGYGFSRRMTVFLRGERASVDYADLATSERYDLTVFDLGARYSAGSTDSRWRPYLEASLSRVDLGDELDGIAYSMAGTAGTVGVGVELFLAPNVSIELAGLGTLGSLDSGEFGGSEITVDESLRVGRFTTALTWRP